MDNYKKYKAKIENAKGKTREVRLGITEAINVVDDVEGLIKDNEALRAKIKRLEDSNKNSLAEKINVSGSKF